MASDSERRAESDTVSDGADFHDRREGTGQLGDDRLEIGGVLLAAGESRRFGDENKLLATLEGDPLVAHAVRTLLSVDLAGVVAVVGHEAKRVRAALEELAERHLETDLTFRYNAGYASGQSSSVRTGTEAALDLGWDAAIFALGDMPRVNPETIDRLRTAYGAGRGSILAPAVDGQRGNPVLFDATHFDALASVSGDRGGRYLIETHSDAELISVDDSGVLRDVDERADLRSFE